MDVVRAVKNLEVVPDTEGRHDHKPDQSLLINRVRALFSSKGALMVHVAQWEKGAPFSLLNDQWNTVRVYGYTKDSVAIVLGEDPQKGLFAEIVVLLMFNKNVRFRYYFENSVLEPYYNRLY